ncbi:YeeE/YedE family protein [Amorphus sp. MBR-141]
MSLASPLPRTHAPVIATALAALAAIAVAGALAGGWRLAAAAAIGGVAGVALYHAAFGFTSSWRAVVRERRGEGIRAQALLIVATAAVSFPLLAHGAAIGMPASGYVFPFGIATALGAFLFGLGMQFGAGCGSGTLFAVGGGSTRMVVTLAAFVAGSFLATAHLEAWHALPALPALSLVTLWGPLPAFLATAGVLTAIAAMTLVRERAGPVHVPRRMGFVLGGPWSTTVGALVLAGVGIATFVVLGRPWGITSGFTLWGGKIAHALGVPIETWPYWSGQMGAVERSVFADATSVMDFAIIAGAMLAAGLAGRFAPTLRIGPRDIATALAGGLMMGYGARLAFGCNIGGLVGGIVSGSLHGWGWLVFGFLGSTAGTYARAGLGIDPPVAHSSGPRHGPVAVAAPERTNP